MYRVQIKHLLKQLQLNLSDVMNKHLHRIFVKGSLDTCCNCEYLAEIIKNKDAF